MREILSWDNEGILYLMKWSSDTDHFYLCKIHSITFPLHKEMSQMQLQILCTLMTSWSKFIPNFGNFGWEKSELLIFIGKSHHKKTCSFVIWANTICCWWRLSECKLQKSCGYEHWTSSFIYSSIGQTIIKLNPLNRLFFLCNDARCCHWNIITMRILL